MNSKVIPAVKAGIVLKNDGSEQDADFMIYGELTY